jgi:hypothetical protein
MRRPANISINRIPEMGLPIRIEISRIEIADKLVEKNNSDP